MATTDQPPSVVVCDAGPLIHLDEIGALDLLADFPRVLVPVAVWREVRRHRPAALVHPSLVIQRIAPVMPVPPGLDALSQVLSLHSGGWEALRLALEHLPALLLTDDTAARLAATSLGSPPTAPSANSSAPSAGNNAQNSRSFPCFAPSPPPPPSTSNAVFSPP